MKNTLTQKVEVVTKAFLDVFGPGPQEAEGSISKLVASVTPQLGESSVSRSTDDVLEYFNKSPLLRMVGGRIASDTSSLAWRVYAPASVRNGGLKYAKSFRHMPMKSRHKMLKAAAKKGDMIEIPNHPITTLIHDGNGVLIGSINRKLTQLHLDLVGEAFWLLMRNVAGAPVEAYVIPPSWVMKTPDKVNPYFEIGYGKSRVEVPSTEIIWFLDPDPQKPYGRGSGIGQTLADELEIEEFASKHVKGFFKNRARPDILITGPGLKTEAATRLEMKWVQKLQGFMKSYTPFFMEAPDGMKLHELSQDFESMQLTDLRKHERDIVIQTFGAPPEIFGVVESSNRATIDAADFIVAKHVLEPRLELQRNFLQYRLVPEYGDESLVVDYDSPIDEDKEFALKVARAAPFSRMVNEWRELQNLEGVADGDVYMVDGKLRAVESISEVETVQSSPPSSQESDPSQE